MDSKGIFLPSVRKGKVMPLEETKTISDTPDIEKYEDYDEDTASLYFNNFPGAVAKVDRKASVQISQLERPEKGDKSSKSQKVDVKTQITKGRFY
jgi:hypothetical protein